MSLTQTQIKKLSDVEVVEKILEIIRKVEVLTDKQAHEAWERLVSQTNIAPSEILWVLDSVFPERDGKRFTVNDLPSANLF